MRAIELAMSVIGVVNMKLVVGIPVRLEGGGEDIRIHDPRALVAVGVAVAHLHRLRLSIAVE